MAESRLSSYLRLLAATVREAGVKSLELSNHHRAVRDGFLSMEYGTYGRPKVNHYKGDTGRVIIGRFCSIAGDVQFTPGGQHRADWISTYPFGSLVGVPNLSEVSGKGDIVVGNDVWIGKGAAILSGVTVGHGAVIGSYSVVSRPVRPYAVVVGNPAREARRRFTDDVVESLLRVAWWDWPLEEILSNAQLLQSGRVDELIDRFTEETAADRVTESPLQ